MALVDSENCRKEEEKSHLPSVLPNEDKSLPVASVESEISEKEEDDPEFCKIMEEVLQLYEKVVHKEKNMVQQDELILQCCCELCGSD
ncbi:hypothetical protein HN873_062525 [Arachis hypogaea]